MKKLLQFLFISIILINCKGETKDTFIKSDIITIQKKHENLPIKNKKEDCYTYLTEMVRSSNFPLTEWKVSKEKVNLLIDEQNDEFIRAKLLIDNDGTGTIGWIEYYFDTGKLLNTSANLEKPEELKYDKKWSILLNEYLNISVKTITKKTPSSGLNILYNNSTLISLPNKYSYDFINDEKGFSDVSKDLENIFNLENFSNFKIAKLPDSGLNKVVFLLGYDESGQSKLYLITLNSSFIPIDKLLLYSSEEIDGNTISTTYELSQNYFIKIKKSKITGEGNNVKEKILNADQYSITDSGKFMKSK